ncbi:hypothetical protein [Halosimplex halobium]|uniref:hypothetical protein n=1 Tax=Halosimplex halobium TaxID=3396618 RepID=UPI003F545BB1
MSETAQSTLEVLTEIARSLNNGETVTLDDDLKRDLGFPVDDDYDHKEPVVSGSNGAEPITHRIYDIDGYWLHVKTAQDKPRGTTTYVKHVGRPRFNPIGLDEGEFREVYEAHRQRGLDALDKAEVAPEYSKDIFAAADEYQRNTAEADAGHVGDGVAAVTDGTRIWMEHTHASRFVDLDHYFDVELNEDGKKAVKEAIRESTAHSAPGHIASGLIVEYTVEVEYDAEPLLEG